MRHLSFDELKPGEGAIVRDGLSKVAAFPVRTPAAFLQQTLRPSALISAVISTGIRSQDLLGLPLPRLPIRHRRRGFAMGRPIADLLLVK